MDGGLGDKIREILNDPEAMAKIAQIASGLSPPQNTAQTGAPSNTIPASSIGIPQGGIPQSGVPQGGNSSASSAMSALSSLTGISSAAPSGDRRLALLSSLRPLMREEKRKKLDNLKTALTIAGIIGNFKKHT